MPLTPIRSLLPGAARRSGISRDLAITNVLRACQRELARVFGDEYSKFAEPVAVRPDGALVIACRSPAVAQTVRLREDALRAGIRGASAGIAVTRLYLIPRSRADADASYGREVAEE